MKERSVKEKIVGEKKRWGKNVENKERQWGVDEREKEKECQ